MADFIGAIDQGTTSTRFMVFDRKGRGGFGAERAPADLPRARMGGA